MNKARCSKRSDFRFGDLIAGTSIFACLAAVSSSAFAGPATKSGSGTDLTGATAGVWTGGSGTNGSPTSTEAANWNSSSLGAGLTVGSAVNWSSINITGALTNIDITGAGAITTGAITLAGSQTLSIANAITVSGSPTWNIGDATGNANADAMLSGTITDAGVITKMGAGTLELTGTGNSFGNYVIINDGTLLVSGGTNTNTLLAVGNAGTTANFFNLTGGQWTQTTQAYIGNGTTTNGTTGVSTANFSGGNFTSVSDFNLGVRRSAVMNVSSGASVNLAKITTLWQGNATAGSTAKLNLDGGTLTASTIQSNNTNFDFTVNLNGGLLKVGANNGTLLNSNLTRVNVRDGGAKIDTNGNNTTIAAALQHSNIGNDNATDGGLTKTGNGILTLSGANTYTGATNVNGGKLTVSSTGTINATSGVSIGAGEFNYNNSTTAMTQGVTFSGTGGTLSGSGTITQAVTVTSGNAYTAGDLGSAGSQNVSGGVSFNNGSIFSWDVSSNGQNYDKLVTASLAGEAIAGDAIFRIVVGDASFANSFWSQSHTWMDIFTTNGTTAIADWANLFSPTVAVVNSNFAAITPVNGSFSISGSNLTWTAVPEPTSALAGVLLGAGLLRRRRGQTVFTSSI